MIGGNSRQEALGSSATNACETQATAIAEICARLRSEVDARQRTNDRMMWFLDRLTGDAPPLSPNQSGALATAVPDPAPSLSEISRLLDRLYDEQQRSYRAAASMELIA